MSFTRPQKRAGTGRSPRITTRIAVGLMAIALALTGVGAPIAPAQAAEEFHTIQFVTPDDWSGSLDGYEFWTDFDTGDYLLLTIDAGGIAQFTVPEGASSFTIEFTQEPTLEQNFATGFVTSSGAVSDDWRAAKEFDVTAGITPIELTPAGVISGQINVPSDLRLDLSEWTVMRGSPDGGSPYAAQVHPDGSFTLLGVPFGEPYFLVVFNELAFGSEVAQGYVTASGALTSNPDEVAEFYAGQNDVQINMALDIKIEGEIALPIDPEDFTGGVYVYAEDLQTGYRTQGFTTDETFQIPGLENGKQYLLYFEPSDYYGTRLAPGYLNAAGELVLDRDAATLITAPMQGVVAQTELSGTLNVTVALPTGMDRNGTILEVGLIESGTEKLDTQFLYSYQNELSFTGLNPGREYRFYFSHWSTSFNVPTGYIGPDGTLVRTLEEAQVFTSADTSVLLNLHAGTSISGQVHIPQDSNVNRDHVMAFDVETGTVRGGVFDSSGNFELSGLWPGIEYHLQTRQVEDGVYLTGFVANDGYLTTDSTDYLVATAPQSDIDIYLTPGAGFTGHIALPAGVSTDVYDDMYIEVQTQDDIWGGAGEVDSGGSFTLLGAISNEPVRIYVRHAGGNPANLVHGYLTADGSLDPRESKAHLFTAPQSGVEIVTEVGTTVAVELKARTSEYMVLYDTYLGLFDSDGELVTDYDVNGDRRVTIGSIPAGEDYYLGLHSEGWDAENPTYTYLGAGGFLVDDIAHAVRISTPASGIAINMPSAYVATTGVISGTLQAPAGWAGTGADLEVCAFDSVSGDPAGCAQLNSSGAFSLDALQAGVGYTLFFRDAEGNLRDGAIISSGAVGTDAAVFHASVSPEIQLQPTLKVVPVDPDPGPSGPTKPVTPKPTTQFAQIVPTADLSGDGIADVLAVDHDGVLWLYRGKANGGLSSASKLGSGWGGLEVSAPGDFNGDGKADILAKAANGDLFFYPGDGKGGLGKSTKAGWNWGAYDIIPAGDVTGDGIADVLALNAQGELFYYAGNGKGGFTGKLTKNGQGWTNIDLYPAGDLNGDGNADILSIRKDGTLHTHLGRGDGGFSKSTKSGQGWAGYELFAGSDANGDGLADLYSRDSQNRLWFYAGKAGGFRSALQVGNSW